MELICRIVKQGELEEREYTSRDNTVERFASMSFELQHGSDRIYAEMVQETARKCGKLDLNYYYVASLNLKVASFKDKNDKERWETRVVCTKLSVL